MRVGLVSLIGVSVLLAWAPTVAAADGTLAGRAAFPVAAAGQHHAIAAAGEFLLGGDAGQAGFLLQGTDGQAVRIVTRAFSIVSTQDPKANVMWQQKVERVSLPMAGALLQLTQEGRLPAFQMLAYDGAADLGNGAANGPLSVALQPSDKQVSDRQDLGLSVELIDQAAPFEHTIPAGVFAARAGDGRLTMDGPMKLYVSGADLTYIGPDGKAQPIGAHSRTEQRPGIVYDPVAGTWFGGGTHTERITEYLQVDGAGHLDAHFADVAGTLFAPETALAVEGEATLPAMHGIVTITDKDKVTRHVLRGEDLTLAGRFTLQLQAADGEKGTTGVSGTGDFTTVAYGTVAAHYDWATAIAAVGLGAAVLAAIAWAIANGKTAIGVGGGLVAGYARVHGDEVLEHPGRAEVYERVKAFPGVNFVQLAAQVEFGTSTLNYHLRVLERNAYVISVRDGRYLRFFDRRSGHYSSNKKLAVSALRNTKTAAMAQHIRANPGVAQCDLAQAFGVTASTVTWHINRLANAGLVQKSRDAHRTRYYLGEAWASLPMDEQVRQGMVEERPALA